MIQKYSIVLLILSLITFSGCVSKKKYLEMEAGRMKAEKLAAQLDEENNAKAARIEALIADFESMKNELLENNAIKEQVIDSLNGTIFELSENLETQKNMLQRTSTDLNFEQKRLNDELAEKERNIANLEKEVTRLENEVSEKNDQIDQKNFDLGKLKDEAVILNGKIQSGDQKLGQLQTQLDKLKTDVSDLQKQITEKDETILRLENNVKLLKNELGR
jgi:chromosome segregation ATPase